jgi:hypothetical protein
MNNALYSILSKWLTFASWLSSATCQQWLQTWVTCWTRSPWDLRLFLYTSTWKVSFALLLLLILILHCIDLPPSPAPGTKEDQECSGQGVCDSLTGTCRCSRGYGSSNGTLSAVGERYVCLVRAVFKLILTSCVSIPRRGDCSYYYDADIYMEAVEWKNARSITLLCIVTQRLSLHPKRISEYWL